jgi:hypothetical protein
MLRKLILAFSLSPLLACSWMGIDDNIDEIYPCLDGNCHSYFKIDPWVSPNAYQDKNEYWHIKYWGPKYFTITGKLDELHPKYIINEIPLVEAAFDSNYWVAFDDLTFTIPLYSPFGLQTQTGTKIPVINKTLNIGEIAKLMEPLNIAGYQITKNTCFTCPYSDRLFATYSSYSYNPKQQIYLDERMVGDTLEVYVKVTFNIDTGVKEENFHTLKVIIDK